MNPNDVVAKEENGKKKPLSLRAILRKMDGFQTTEVTLERDDS
jgi:hypothetical protein